MPTRRYTVTPQPIDTLLPWIKIGETTIAKIYVTLRKWLQCLI